ncbi:MAG: nuclear transport factor 2 family protein [Acidimicrobiales bacterium]|nr:SnoaL-like domain-containing protein [Hyphomonadaceae bacterium]RZV41487.1 MAG: nuclear transport factor 2 family protein [Acidimicrobiales bacterium]
MTDFQRDKQIVRDYTAAFDSADPDDRLSVLKAYTVPDYYWRGMHPFYELSGAEAVFANFWDGLFTSFTSVQRRMDIFFAGQNIYSEKTENWVCNMGHFVGLFDQDWLGIPATHKMAYLPYAEFHRIEDGKIAESALFCDIIRIMQQVGLDPIPTQTAAAIIQPGPQTHDGFLFNSQDPKEAQISLDLVAQMVEDLNILNQTGDDRCPPSVLAETWHQDMVWYGPGGIGSTYTIERYQEQHQYPFREGLTDKKFLGHVTRIAEGNYVGWFGWPNLTNRNRGGFLGLLESDKKAEMRVVDIYRRDGDKLAENWVFIDILYYLIQHDVDLLKNPDALKR